MENDGMKKDHLDSVVAKAKYIFDLCDQERNGFISKRDLLKLKAELPLSIEQLEDVFDCLDVTNRGFLTHKEFVNGFRNFTDAPNASLLKFKEDDDDNEYDDGNEFYVSEPVLKPDSFDELLLSLSQCAMLKDLDTIRSLWSELRQGGGEDLLVPFESLMVEVVGIVNRSQIEYQSMRESVEKQRLRYNEEMYLMHSEVEAKVVEQMAEKKEREKEMKMRKELLQQLKEKDQVLQELKEKQTILETQFCELNTKRTDSNNNTIESAMQPLSSYDEVDNDDNGSLMKKKVDHGLGDEWVKALNYRNGSTTSEISEWMEVERQHLLCYISQIEKKNKDLQDLQDELEDKILSPKRHKSTCQSPSRDHQAIIKFVNPRFERETSPENSVKKSNHRNHHSFDNHHHSNPHLFRVVFVGDSGVGKTTLLHRFCLGDFNPSLSTTVGVDSQMCSRKVGGRKVVMQMWDTAGQERFRSFSHQYFRRADAVVLAYDISAPHTFISLRAWLDHIQDSVEDDTVLMMVGTKLDLLTTQPFPMVSASIARKLALEYGTSFFETSSLNGYNIEEAVNYLATVLKERQEKLLETSLSLYSLPIKLSPLNKIKRQCCGSMSF